jgi:hypothetical protein
VILSPADRAAQEPATPRPADPPDLDDDETYPSIILPAFDGDDYGEDGLEWSTEH